MSRRQLGRIKLKASLSPLLEADVERALLARAQAGDRAAMGALIDSHMRLIMQIAGRYQRESLGAHDLVSEGVLGLIEAISRFDLSHSTRLNTYAAWWIRARVRAYAFENRRAVPMPSTRAARITRAQLGPVRRRLAQTHGREPSHAEVAAALGVSEADVALVANALSSRDLPLGSHPSGGHPFEPRDERLGPEQEVAQREVERALKSAVAAALERLSERDRKILQEQFFADEEKSMAEVGRALGISRQRVCQIVLRLRRELGRELRGVAC